MQSEILDIGKPKTCATRQSARRLFSSLSACAAARIIAASVTVAFLASGCAFFRPTGKQTASECQDSQIELFDECVPQTEYDALWRHWQCSRGMVDGDDYVGCVSICEDGKKPNGLTERCHDAADIDYYNTLLNDADSEAISRPPQYYIGTGVVAGCPSGTQLVYWRQTTPFCVDPFYCPRGKNATGVCRAINQNTNVTVEIVGAEQPGNPATLVKSCGIDMFWSDRKNACVLDIERSVNRTFGMNGGAGSDAFCSRVNGSLAGIWRTNRGIPRQIKLRVSVTAHGNYVSNLSAQVYSNADQAIPAPRQRAVADIAQELLYSTVAGRRGRTTIDSAETTVSCQIENSKRGKPVSKPDTNRETRHDGTTTKPAVTPGSKPKPKPTKPKHTPSVPKSPDD